MRPFTVQDVLDAYALHGVKACTAFNVNFKDDVIKVGSWVDENACCPLSVLFIGQSVDVAGPENERGIVYAATTRWPGFNPWNFIRGFDGANTLETAIGHAVFDREGGWDEEAYNLGVECRAACIEAGLLDVAVVE